MKVALTVLVLGLLPGIAAAQSSCDHEQAMSCAEGQTYDTEAGACVPITTS